MESADVNSIYELIGKLAIKFSQLEYLSEYALQQMIAKNDFMVGPLLVRNLSFSKKVEMIKLCINYHFVDDSVKKETNTTLWDRIDKKRSLRNNFIHGDWDIDSYGNNNNRILVRNYKLNYDKQEKLLKYMTEKRYTTNELKEECREVESIIEKVKLMLPEYEILETRSWLATASPKEIEKFAKQIAELSKE